MDSRDQRKTLEQLENNYWGDPVYDSNVVVDSYRLRKVPLKDLTPENLRLMLSQSIGIKYLVPVALEMLENNFFVETDFGTGYLLRSLIMIDIAYWYDNREQKKNLIGLVNKHQELLNKTDLPPKMVKDMLARFEQLEAVE